MNLGHQKIKEYINSHNQTWEFSIKKPFNEFEYLKNKILRLENKLTNIQIAIDSIRTIENSEDLNIIEEIINQ